MDKNSKMITVNGITKTFHIPLEKSSGIKQKVTSIFSKKKGYRVFSPLNDISFDVNEGDFFGIVGKNGSGKSTLLKTLAGIYAPDNGSVDVAGSLVPFIELGVGFNPELTGRENVFLNGALLGFSHKEITKMYRAIVDFAELEEFMEERLKNYSSGMQVRLAFSIAIQAKGDILLLDEVLAVGDAAFQQKCFDYFEKLKQEKKTIVIVTHDMSAVKRFCNRALFLRDGKIVRIGTPDEIADLYTEDNIEKMQLREKKSTLNSALKLTIDKQRYKQDDDANLTITYSHPDYPVYVNVSLGKNGIIIADYNTKNQPRLNSDDKKVTLKYKQPLHSFNPGVYDFYVSVHRAIDDHLVEHLPRAATFFIQGYDESRDGAVRLQGEWSNK